MITGQFRDKKDTLYTVNIGASANLTIGEDGIYFGGNPVEITCDIDSTFDHIIKHSATITFLTDQYIGDQLFANNPRDISVEIFKGNDCIFSGYVEPNTFSQPYARIKDEFTVNCIDALSTMQYYKYRNMKSADYPTYKNTADSVTFLSVLNRCLNGICSGAVYYDQSKGVSSARCATLFSDLKLSELVILGDDFSDVWTDEETMTEMLQYLNLHIIQQGRDYYIFDWNTITNKRTSWVDLLTGDTMTTTPVDISIVSEDHASDNTNLSVADVYSSVQIECELQSEDTVIESPLDSSYLTSLYNGKVRYMDEIISEGEGESAYNAFLNMIAGTATNYKDAKVVEWYVLVSDSANWKMYINGSTALDTIYEKAAGVYVNQWKVARSLQQNDLRPGIFRFGFVEGKPESTDNSPTNNVSLTPYLFISINGNEDHSENGHSPSDAQLQSRYEQTPHPMIEYVGNTSGGSFSPVDEATTNYLVFSGKMLLQARQWETDRYAACVNHVPSNEPYTKAGSNTGVMDKFFHATVPSDKNPDGRYYTRKFYNMPTHRDPLSVLSGVNLQPWTADKGNHTLQYNYSAEGDGTDLVSKIDILECELIIGNKRCVEYDKDQYGNSKFKWVDVNSGVEQTYEDENGHSQTYLKKTISLGINPKIGDYLVGDEFSIQNTIDYTMNLSDAEGTAIPIKKADALTGAVIFRILGPVNNVWDDITRRHPTAFRHTKWTTTTKFILAACENIIIKDFECKIYSDNGGNTIDQDNDLIYISDEQRVFFQKKDDITFHLVTQLSSAECYEKGIQNGVNLNAVTNGITDEPLTSLYNATTGETAKAEEHYIDQYYTAYSHARVILETDLWDNEKISIFNHYTSTGLGKTFFVQSLSRSLRYNVATLTLKELL